MQILLTELETLSRENVRVRSAGLSTEIFLDLGNENYFPDQFWVDFASRILGWWIGALLDQMENGGCKVNNFMDGPFEFRTEIEGSNIHFQCIISYISWDKTEYRFTVKVTEYAQELLNAAAEIFDFFQKYPDLHAPEIEELKTRYAKLKTKMENGKIS